MANEVEHAAQIAELQHLQQLAQVRAAREAQIARQPPQGRAIELPQLAEHERGRQGDQPARPQSDPDRALRQPEIDEKDEKDEKEERPAFNPITFVKAKYTQRLNVHRTIPPQCVPLWVETCKPFLLRYSQLSQAGDKRAASRQLLGLLDLPAKLLRKQTGGRRRGNVEIKKALQAFLMRPNNAEEGEPIVSEGPLRQQGPAFVTAATARRMNALCDDNFISKASHLPMQLSMAPACADTIARLETLHPSAPADERLPPLPAEAQRTLIVDLEELKRVIFESNRGASPGLSGLTADHLWKLCEDVPCLQGIADIVKDICNHEVSQEAWALVNASALLALTKAKGGIRPVTTKEIFHKIPGRFALNQCDQLFPDSGQLGVQVPGGCSTAALTVQAALETSDTTFALFVDTHNAFNELKRQSMLEQANANEAFAPALRFIHATYSSPSALVYFDPASGQVASVMSSVRGSQQGETFGTALWANAVEADVVSSTEGLAVASTAIADNLMFVATESASAETVLDRIEAAFTQHGLRLNPHESCILWPRDAPVPESLSQLIERRHLQLLTGAAKVVGTFVGCDERAKSDLVLDAIESMKGLFDVLQHSEISDRNADRLIREVALQRPQHLMASLPAQVSKPALQRYDALALDAFAAKHHFLREQLAQQGRQLQIGLAISEGGIGIRPLAPLCEGASVSALALAAKHIARARRKMQLAPLSSDSLIAQPVSLLPHQRAAQNALESLRRETQGSGLKMPKLTDVLLPGQESVPRQKELTEALEKVRNKRALERAPLRLKLRLHSLKQKSARRFQSSRHGDDLVMSKTQYCTTMRLILDLPATDDLADRTCQCGVAMREDPTHPMACSRGKRLESTSRHDMVEAELSRAVEAAGAFARRQYSDDGSVPDITVNGLFGFPGAVTVDVTVLHVLVCSNLDSGRRNATMLLDTREKMKHRRYDQQSRLSGKKFFPFALDSYGMLAPKAHEFLALLGQQASACFGISASGFVAQWSTRILRALHIGNTLLMLAGANRSK